MRPKPSGKASPASARKGGKVKGRHSSPAPKERRTGRMAEVRPVRCEPSRDLEWLRRNNVFDATPDEGSMRDYI